MRGDEVATVVNDPEKDLEGYKLEGLNPNQCVEVAAAEFPGEDWYRAYQAAALSGDSRRARELLVGGAAALGPPTEGRRGRRRLSS
jgi:hypothetical protein